MTEVKSLNDDDRLPSRFVGAAVSELPGGGFFEPLVTKYTTRVLDEWQRLRSPALKAASRVSGMSREDMAECLEQNPEAVPLVARILFHAGMTNQDEMLDALGAMLGALLTNLEDTDEVEMIVIGLGDLRRVHLQILRVLEQEPHALLTPRQAMTPVEHFERGLQDNPGELPDGPPDLIPSDTWSIRALAHVSDLSSRRVELAVAGLQKSGFATSPPALDGPGYLISESGRTVLEVLRRHRNMADATTPGE